MIEEVIVCDEARIPIVWLVTHEEARAEAALAMYAKKTGGEAWVWSLTSDDGGPGWEPTQGQPRDKKIPFDKELSSSPEGAVKAVIDHAHSLEEAAETQDSKNSSRVIALFKDPHVFLSEDMSFVRMLRDATRELRDTEGLIVCISPEDKLPIDLRTDVAVVHPGLPSKETIQEVMKQMLEDYGMEDQDIDSLASACVGLTLNQAVDAFAKSITQFNKVNLPFIQKIKTEAISSVPGLTYIEDVPSWDQVGGIAGLKEWLELRKAGFSQAARDANLPIPKGVLTLGVSGCLHGDTPIWDPIAKTNWTVSYRQQVGNLFNVLSRDEEGKIKIGTAMPPVKYPKSEMIKFYLENGHTIKVTPDHRFWNGTEWVFASTFVKLLEESEDVLLPTNSDIDLSIQFANVFHSMNKVREQKYTRIVKAERCKSEEYYDFHVPIYNNYLAGSVWNHNCGKSLLAKAISSYFNRPLIRLNPPDLKGGLVGETESNIRQMQDRLDALDEVILWIDEFEKGLPKQGVQNADGGTSDALLLGILYWMQERKGKAFLVATSNNVSALPPELLRKGRWDEIFFVDLPTYDERLEIFNIHLKLRNWELPEEGIKKLASQSSNFSGAEIEAACIAGKWKAFSRNEELTTEDILGCLKTDIPLYHTMEEQIRDLRDWAKNRAKPASFQAAEEPVKKTKVKKPGGRKINLKNMEKADA